MTQAFPLLWPTHIKRTPIHNRQWGSFQVTPGRAKKDLLAEIGRSGGTNPVISTNIPTLRDGSVTVDSRKQSPDDCGVAVYFTRKGKSVCIPCDTFDAVWKNIRAIGLSIKDMRGPETRGCAAITDQAFTGFTALPPPDQMSTITTPVNRNWWDVLSVSPACALPVAEAAWKSLCRSTPENERYELNAAVESARKALK